MCDNLSVSPTPGESKTPQEPFQAGDRVQCPVRVYDDERGTNPRIEWRSATVVGPAHHIGWDNRILDIRIRIDGDLDCNTICVSADLRRLEASDGGEVE